MTDPDLANRIIEVLHTVYDPEIPVDIYELGLIYGLTATPEGVVAIQMTLSTPGCPVAESLLGEVKDRVEAVAGVKEVRVELVWDPPWDMDRMSEAARLTLGM